MRPAGLALSSVVRGAHTDRSGGPVHHSRHIQSGRPAERRVGDIAKRSAPAHPLIQLQRTVGNHAVMRLITGDLDAPPTVNAGSRTSEVPDPLSPAQLVEDSFVYTSLDAARHVMRDLIYIKGTALGLLGDLGTEREFIGGIAQARTPNGESRYAVINIEAHEEAAADVNVGEYSIAAVRLAIRQGLRTRSPTLAEFIHSHPSGIRARMEYGAGINSFSGPDKDFVKETGIALGLLTPSGEVKVLEPGQVEAGLVVWHVERRNKAGDYVPNRDDLRTLIRHEIYRIVKDRTTITILGETFDAGDLDDPELSASVRRKLERVVNRYERRFGRAMRKLSKSPL